MLSVDRLDLARRLAELCHLEGSFVLRSGVSADVYFDKYQFESDPDTLRAVAAGLQPLIPPDTDLLAGLELGGVPVATALSLGTGIPTVFVRKQAKSYGTAKLAEGPPVTQRRLLVVEDVVTSGGQIVESVTQLRTLGADITTALCVIDRQQGGTENLAAAGIELRSLFARADLTR